MPFLSPSYLQKRRTSQFLKSKKDIIYDTTKPAFPEYAPILAKAEEYIEPQKARLEIWDLKHLEKIYEYDSFSRVSNQFLVTNLDVELGIDSHGVFNLNIFDSDKYIDSRLLKRKNLVVISTKKYTSEDYENMLYGMQTKVQPLRPDTNLLSYRISGIGTGAALNERIVNYTQIGKPQSIINSNTITNDQSMQSNNMMKKLFTDSSLYVVDDESIAEQLSIDVSLLDSSNVKDIMGGMSQTGVTAGQIYSAILDGVGAQGGINANNQAYMRYPSSTHSGIKLKSWNYIDDAENTDLAKYTSYFMGPFQYEISWSKEDGFTNRWISSGRRQDLLASSSNSTTVSSLNPVGSVPLWERDLAQKFTPTKTNIRDLALMLQKVGAGTSDPNYVFYLHGHIVEDWDGFPTGDVLSYFDIPLVDIPSTLSPVYMPDLELNYKIDYDTDLWIILYDRGYQDADTIRWGVIDKPVNPSVNAVRYYHWNPPDPWALDHYDEGGWDIHTNSYSFMFSAFDSFTHQVIAEDPDSIDRFGIVEDTLNVDWAPNSNVVNQIATERLFWTAMPKVVYSANMCTIPGKIFLPGQIISIQDELSDLPDNMNITADILNVHYSFGSSGGYQGGTAENSSPLGAVFVDLSPLGYYDFRSIEGEGE